MSLFRYLKEDLESANVQDGRGNFCTYDMSKYGYEMYFKVGPVTYSFLADVDGTQYEDGCYKIQMRRKIAGNTEDIPDTKEVVNAFVEAMVTWVTNQNPNTFYWFASELYPAYNEIALELSKKLKKYNFINENVLTPESEMADAQDREQQDKKYKRYIFTKNEPKEILGDKYWDNPLDDNEKTFDKFEKPVDIKPNPDFVNPLSKTLKLDKNIGYNESFINKIKDKLIS